MHKILLLCKFFSPFMCLCLCGGCPCVWFLRIADFHDFYHFKEFLSPHTNNEDFPFVFYIYDNDKCFILMTQLQFFTIYFILPISIPTNCIYSLEGVISYSFLTLSTTSIALSWIYFCFILILLALVITEWSGFLPFFLTMEIKCAFFSWKGEKKFCWGKKVVLFILMP